MWNGSPRFKNTSSPADGDFCGNFRRWGFRRDSHIRWGPRDRVWGLESFCFYLCLQRIFSFWSSPILPTPACVEPATSAMASPVMMGHTPRITSHSKHSFLQVVLSKYFLTMEFLFSIFRTSSCPVEEALVSREHATSSSPSLSRNEWENGPQNELTVDTRVESSNLLSWLYWFLSMRLAPKLSIIWDDLGHANLTYILPAAIRSHPHISSMSETLKWQEAKC